LPLPGQSFNRTYRLRDSVMDPGNKAPADFFDGIDVTIPGLARFAGPNPPASLTKQLQAIATAVADAQQAFKSKGPAATIQPLAAGRDATLHLAAVLSVEDLPPLTDTARREIGSRLELKLDQFDKALLAATGTRLEALADDGVVARGQNVTVSVYASSNVPDAPMLKSVTLAGFDGVTTTTCQGPLAAGKAVTCKATGQVPTGTHYSTPYWKPRKDSARYDFEPDVPFGVPFRPSPFTVTYELTIGGVDLTIKRDVEYRYDDVTAGEKRMDLKVVPAFNVRVSPDIAVIPAATAGTRELRVTVTNNEKGAASGNVTLSVPSGWTATPASAPVTFAREDEETTVRFTVSPGAHPKVGESMVTATMTAAGGATSNLGYQVIEYPHIHRQHYIEPASARVKVIDVSITPNLQVGYVMGVGDKVPPAIEQLGAHVAMIDADTLAFGDLSKYDVIVTGVRAYERRPDLRANNTRLIQYAENGGTVLVQYNKFEFNQAQYGPYPAKVSSNRVTDENAPIEILTPDNPVFTRPNRIGPEAWANWVQERGLYFLGERDSRYVDLVRTQDPFPLNAGPKTGALVEANVGKGRWIYIGLGLWRQLPAGTDGAYRLLANLLSLGKQ
jgi:hypothetical protein